MTNNCLTYEQLAAYTSTKIDDVEYSKLYDHISTCELCTYAVKGFVAAPFAYNEIIGINNRLDAKLYKTSVSFTHVIIAALSIISILGFYTFADSFSANKTTTVSIENTPSRSLQLKNQKVPILIFENKIVTDIKKRKNVIEKKLIKSKIDSPESINNITTSIIELPVKPANKPLEPAYNANIIYIYNLKVTDCYNLYFKQTPNKFNPHNYTPSFKENKKTKDDSFEKDTGQIFAANKVLKKGLEYFDKEKYYLSIAEFQILLENNPTDINALFYSAVAFYKTGQNNLAIKYLNAVINNTNNSFLPEAKWNLALVYIKTGEVRIAKQLLLEVIKEEGFYAKNAQERLVTLK
jgi:hypothetical protein